MNQVIYPLWHGTSSVNLPAILENGLNSFHSASPVFSFDHRSHLDGNCVACDAGIAEWYAKNSVARYGGELTVILCSASVLPGNIGIDHSVVNLVDIAKRYFNPLKRSNQYSDFYTGATYSLGASHYFNPNWCDDYETREVIYSPQKSVLKLIRSLPEVEAALHTFYGKFMEIINDYIDSHDLMPAFVELQQRGYYLLPDDMKSKIHKYDDFRNCDELHFIRREAEIQLGTVLSPHFIYDTDMNFYVTEPIIPGGSNDLLAIFTRKVSPDTYWLKENRELIWPDYCDKEFTEEDLQWKQVFGSSEHFDLFQRSLEESFHVGADPSSTLLDYLDSQRNSN